MNRVLEKPNGVHSDEYSQCTVTDMGFTANGTRCTYAVRPGLCTSRLSIRLQASGTYENKQ